MNFRILRHVFCGFAVLLAAARLAAQSPLTAADLIGTWRLVSVDNIMPDGTRVQLYGPNPVGLLVYDTAGNYSLQIMRAGRPKFAANDKSKGTPEENQALAQGTNCHFGRYEVLPAEGVVATKVEHATFTNWEGTTRKSKVVIEGNEMRYVVAQPTTGGPGVTGEVVWRRVR